MCLGVCRNAFSTAGVRITVLATSWSVSWPRSSPAESALSLTVVTVLTLAVSGGGLADGHGIGRAAENGGSGQACQDGLLGDGQAGPVGVEDHVVCQHGS